MTDSEDGYKWWLRYIIVPLVGGGGLVALLVAVIDKPSPPSIVTPVTTPTSSSQTNAVAPVPSSKAVGPMGPLELGVSYNQRRPI
jgi:hypothetical protein